MYKISVIIPVYNTAEYLEECIESVINQTLTDIEIIILNDGSTDNSENIILSYCKQDIRIKYFKHDNMGLGPTRNRGIELATGRYLSFIDSDDYIDLEMFEKLYQAAEKHNGDIICCEVYLLNDNQKKSLRRALPNNKVVSLYNEDNNSFFREFYFGRIYSHNAWDKIYRTELVKKNNVIFGDNKRIFAEDNFFQIQILLYANVIVFINSPMYIYRNRLGSIMNTYKENLIERHLSMIKELNQIVLDTNQSPLFKQVIALLAFDSIIIETKNVYESRRGIKSLELSIQKFLGDLYIDQYLQLMLKENALWLEPSKGRRYLIKLTSYLVKFKSSYLITLLFFIIYRFKR